MGKEKHSNIDWVIIFNIKEDKLQNNKLYVKDEHSRLLDGSF